MSAQQYKEDFFKKLKYPFKKGRSLVDIGCGDGLDYKYFLEQCGLSYTAMDVFEHPLIRENGITFKKGSIFKLPFKKTFDYVFLRDVLHHVDEKKQSRKKHLSALINLRTITKKGGSIIITEGNRYNPIFYPHMVKMEGHDHFTQKYFKEIVMEAYAKDEVSFRFFEAHVYPDFLLSFFRIYEYIIESIPWFTPFLAYNCAIIKKQ